MAYNRIDPPDLPDYTKRYGVSAGVLAGGVLFISGQPPVDRERRVVGTTFEEQTRVALDAFTRVLTDAGCTWDHVVKVTAVVLPEGFDAMEQYFGVLKEYLERYSSKRSLAHTYIVARSLVVEGVLIEIEGVAVKA